MELTTVGTPVMLAQLKDAIDNNKAVAFYYWTPEWIHAAYKLQARSRNSPATTDSQRHRPLQCRWPLHVLSAAGAQ
jgi:ABC-type proline/glycine betaine transport system substrate-binding protein